MTYRPTSLKFTSCVVVFALWASFSFSQEKPRLQSGRLVAAELIGHGKSPEWGANRKSNRGDIWWSYCVSSGDKAYSAVSRVTPSKSGLTVNRTVQFSVDLHRIHIINAKGERFTMRIIRQGDESICH